MTPELSELARRLRDSLDERKGLLPRGSQVLVALSGGPDSMGLLHLLRELSAVRGLELWAAHFDHGLRPRSSEEAEEVRRWSEEAGVPCVVGAATEDLERTQEAFRRARYGYLQEAADEVGADRLATGHQADDQAETVLFRILRGTGVRGLAGIPERRGRIVRPLLPFRRSEIIGYLEARGIPYLRDPSNRDPEWDRTRVRHEVLPALEAAWDGSVREQLLELAGAARRTDAALQDRAREALEEARVREGGAWAEEALCLRRDRLAGLGEELRGRVVREAARRLGVELTRGGTREAVQFISRGQSGTGIDLGGGLELAREFDRLWIGRPDEPTPDTGLVIEDADPGAGTAFIGGRRLEVEWGVGLPPSECLYRADLPHPEVDFPLEVRGWRDGDSMRAASGSRKLKKLFNDRRVPRSERAELPLIVGPSGRVIWVASLGRDPKLRPREETERFVVRIHEG